MSNAGTTRALVRLAVSGRLSLLYGCVVLSSEPIIISCFVKFVLIFLIFAWFFPAQAGKDDDKSIATFLEEKPFVTWKETTAHCSAIQSNSHAEAEKLEQLQVDVMKQQIKVSSPWALGMWHQCIVPTFPSQETQKHT